MSAYSDLKCGAISREEYEDACRWEEAMMRIMDTVGVETWEDLKGKYVRAEIESWGGTITKIGNIMDNKWFDIKAFFTEKGEDNEQETE